MARRSSLPFNRLTLLSLASFSLKPLAGETLRPSPLDVAAAIEANGTVDDTSGLTDSVVAVAVAVVDGTDELDVTPVGANFADETSLLMNGSWTVEPDNVRIWA